VSIGGHPVRFWNEMTIRVQESEGRPILIRWERPDSLVERDPAFSEAIVATPTTHPDSLDDESASSMGDGQGPRVIGKRGDHVVFEAEVVPQKGPDDDRYYLGISGPLPNDPMLLREFGMEHRTYTFTEAILSGISVTWVNTKAIVTSLKRIFTGRENLRENVGGPIMIAKVTKEAAEAGAVV